MNTKQRLVFASVFGGSLLALASCGGGDGGTSVSPNSTLSLRLADAPVTGAREVHVRIAGVELQPKTGSAVSFNFATPKDFDLLTLQNGNSAELLGDSTVPSGEYNWIRLALDPQLAGYLIDSNGGRRDLRIPSGFETGLKLVRGFVMPAGGRADFTIDFVLAKSVIAPPGQSPFFLMKPVLRLIDNLQWGNIVGTFDAQTLANRPSCAGKVPVVYLYEGSGVTPDDLWNPTDGAADSAPTVDPLVTQAASIGTNSQYGYRIAFVPAGTYTVAFSCDNDEPTVDETAATPPTITFTTFAQPVTVANGQTATVNF